MRGAWSLSGRPVETVWQTPDHQPGPRLALWLDGGRLHRCGQRWLAWQGLVTARSQAAWDADPAALLEGHHGAAWGGSGEAITLVRSLSGGERLYWARVGDTVLFGTSVRPLLRHPGVDGSLARDVVNDVLLTGVTLFGTQTLHAGIHEVPCGHALVIGDQVGRPAWVGADALRSPVGSLEDLGRELRERLIEAVVAGAGTERPVTVALSGGIDSSAVAAAAVAAFGADQVRAITYEFADPGHSTEVAWARRVAEHLGITNHHVFALKTSDYLAAIPEQVWRSESAVHWPKAFMVLVAREVRRLGASRYLTGFGFGSHMGHLQDLGRALTRTPRPGALLAHWRQARFTGARLPDRLARLHPALEAPHPRLYPLLVQLLAHRGLIDDPRRFFPDALHPLLTEPDLDTLAPELADLPLERALQLHALARGLSCIDVTRSEGVSRQLGVLRVSPGHFRSVVPLAYFPVEPAPRLWTADRALRPGKLLLRHAFRGLLPDDVLFRVKDWGDAVASDDWLRLGRACMLNVLPAFPHDTERYGVGHAAAITAWAPHSILASGLALRLWERMFVELPVTDEPPGWGTLWLGQSRRSTATTSRSKPASASP